MTGGRCGGPARKSHREDPRDHRDRAVGEQLGGVVVLVQLFRLGERRDTTDRHELRDVRVVAAWSVRVELHRKQRLR